MKDEGGSDTRGGAWMKARKDTPLRRNASGISVGAVRFELTTPTQMHHIYTAYSFRFFTKGLCNTIRGPTFGFSRVVERSGATSAATAC